MDVSGLRVIADERERKSGIPDLLSKIGVRTDIVTLRTGDYIVESSTAVERKSVRDLVSSVADGRLRDQCERLSGEFKNPILVLEGAAEEISGAVDNPFVFYAALARVVIDFGISLIQTPDATHTAKLLVSLGAREGARAGAVPRKVRKRPGAPLGDQQVGVLCSVPGIGEQLASRLLARFGTPLGAFSATAAELAQVEGLSAASAKRLRGIVRTRGAKRAPRRAAGASRGQKVTRASARAKRPPAS